MTQSGHTAELRQAPRFAPGLQQRLRQRVVPHHGLLPAVQPFSHTTQMQSRHVRLPVHLWRTVDKRGLQKPREDAGSIIIIFLNLHSAPSHSLSKKHVAVLKLGKPHLLSPDTTSLSQWRWQHESVWKDKEADRESMPACPHPADPAAAWQ